MDPYTHTFFKCFKYRLVLLETQIVSLFYIKYVPTHICFCNRQYLYGLLNSKDNINIKLMIKCFRSLLNNRETLI